MDSDYQYMDDIENLFKDSDMTNIDTPITLAHMSCKLGNIINLMVSLNSDPSSVHSKDHNDQTPIYYAIDVGRIDMVWLLITKGAQLNIIDRHGFSPLHKSIIDKQYDITMLLLIQGAKMDTCLSMIFKKGMNFITNGYYY
jgi:ankyrin repeat protein